MTGFNLDTMAYNRIILAARVLCRRFRRRATQPTDGQVREWALCGREGEPVSGVYFSPLDSPPLWAKQKLRHLRVDVPTCPSQCGVEGMDTKKIENFSFSGRQPRASVLCLSLVRFFRAGVHANSASCDSVEVTGGTHPGFFVEDGERNGASIYFNEDRTAALYYREREEETDDDGDDDSDDDDNRRRRQRRRELSRTVTTDSGGMGENVSGEFLRFEAHSLMLRSMQ